MAADGSTYGSASGARRCKRLATMTTGLRSLSGLAVVAAMLSAGAGAASADTLEELMEGCAQVVAEGTYEGVAAYGVKRLESGRWGSIRRIDGGRVTLLIEIDLRDDTIHSCAIWGYTWADNDSIRAPGLSWAKAEARMLGWMAKRAAEPGNAVLTILAGTPNQVASCPGPGEGFFIAAGPGEFGSNSSGMPDRDRPAMFRVSQAADKAQACGFVQAAGKG